MVVQIRGFIGKIEVQFTTVVARDARRCLPSGTKLRTQGHTFTSSQHETFLTQPKWQQQQKVTMSREGNTDTLKVACMWKPRDAQSVTSLILKRDLENVRRELRNLKTGQHENKRENTTREMTLGEKIAHERTGDAKYDPMCETCLKVRRVSTHPRKAVAQAAHSDYATVKNTKQSAEVKILVGAGLRRETFPRALHHKRANVGDLELFLKVQREVERSKAGRQGLPTGVTAVEQSQANGRAEQRVLALRERFQVMVDDARRCGC